ncbi:hypothetical protein MTR67_026727 [Solanum verrucosum]|uniref:Uncharacterized protein n=1 Tax=Solanum verrucosum TaxID=315347 RepID=A0AAF0QZH7_SOLVR|nr:hypothetical protein MTR67_026727 [Solanum verrucosum]
MGRVSHIEDGRKELVRDVHRLAQLGVRLVHSTKVGVLVHNGSKSSFLADVKAKQGIDLTLVELNKEGRVISYTSRMMKLYDKNYPTHDLELVVGKANVVAYALSQKAVIMQSLCFFVVEERSLALEIQLLDNWMI